MQQTSCTDVTFPEVLIASMSNWAYNLSIVIIIQPTIDEVQITLGTQLQSIPVQLEEAGRRRDTFAIAKLVPRVASVNPTLAGFAGNVRYVRL